MRMGRGTGGWYGEKGTQPTQQTQVVAAPKAALLDEVRVHGGASGRGADRSGRSHAYPGRVLGGMTAPALCQCAL